ncbi:glycosyl hydrolase [Xylariaceae sp. FL0804]|nr:glycosyl hydrolase [Xylariaceae sp. FL0804]
MIPMLTFSQVNSLYRDPGRQSHGRAGLWPRDHQPRRPRVIINYNNNIIIKPLNGTIPNNDRLQTLDPTVIRRGSDGKLFLYTTAKNGSVWTSDSLYGPWTHQGSARLPQTGGAPSITELDGVYYLFWNAHGFDYASVGVKDAASHTFSHGSATHVATSTTLEPGDWRDQGRLQIDWSPDYNILDAALLLLLSFGSYQHGIYQIPMADPPVRVAAGAMKQLTHLADNATSGWVGGGPTEAGFVFGWAGYYYLFFSSGRCCRQPATDRWLAAGDVYKVMVCRSRDPRGGYVDDRGRSCVGPVGPDNKESGGRLVLGSHGGVWAPGGQGVMVDAEAGGPLLYYHYVPTHEKTHKPEKKYYFGWNKLDFSSGWPVIV